MMRFKVKVTVELFKEIKEGNRLIESEKLSDNSWGDSCFIIDNYLKAVEISEAVIKATCAEFNRE